MTKLEFMKSTILKFSLLISLTIIFALTTFAKGSAQEVSKEENLHIVDAWARESKGINNSAVYMSIENKKNSNIEIISVVSEVSNKAAIHQTKMEENGVMRMIHIDKLSVPANNTVKLEPEGIHIMLYDLKKQLVKGEKFNVTLKFQNGVAQVVNVEVK